MSVHCLKKRLHLVLSELLHPRLGFRELAVRLLNDLEVLAVKDLSHCSAVVQSLLVQGRATIDRHELLLRHLGVHIN